MANSLNRRNWIKSSALMAGGLALASGTLNKLAAMPVIKKQGINPKPATDETVLLQAPPAMKARLLANENPFGPSAAAKKAITDSLDTSYQYAFMQMGVLAGKIAKYEGISQTNIMLNSGSTPLLHAAAMHFSKGGKNIITGDPSYEDLPSAAKEHGGNWIKVPLTKDYKLDLDAMEAKVDDNTGLVYICNPNNPTATVVDTQKLKDFCERVSKKTMVFVDEAYIDYLPDPQGTTCIGCIKAGQNIIVARTFSKLYGFAGLRCGYIVAQPKTIKMLSIYTPGAFNLSATTMAAAIAAYQETDYMKDALQKTIASREHLYATLKKEGYDYIPSSANFVMFPLKMEGNKFVNEMFKRGVGVRNWKLNGADWCRVSIGRMDEMEAFAAAFKELS
ncbi:histidinol-phosphate transaminase [Mucilaginibacter sp. L3T2-6]|uniref:pyridoxal phosphate-dependent aminotransferase n=1 Tax=Mucilaginibacter sp. L3T2-6 TaxID=3062491 RepID=UPI002675F5DF|nr:histidinol-phosphate transaminase [Mucilaginibacter sp. L3T2-6]MDO3640850.1 histidinol-phosphate transaminase [Mucilaginibacter sp. L3T2-6]MDV6213674.1 histidinol-phosphate transaminase [Mucilaginibacter sp. L3T2-6]